MKPRQTLILTILATHIALPAAPRAAAANATSLLNNAPEAAGYDLVYQLDIPAGASWGNNPIAYQVNNATNHPQPFTRVAYYMELVTGGTTTNWVYVSMTRFTTNLAKLGVPSQYSGEYYHYGAGGNGGGPITNATIRSNVASITPGTGINTICLEFWPYNYTQPNAYSVPGASASAYDFGDSSSDTASYGSMQIHNYGAGQTLFAYNNWNGGSTDIGVGTDPNTGRSNYNPDWTFANNGGSYTRRTLQILVGPYTRDPILWTQPAVRRVGLTSAIAGATLSVAKGSNAVATLYWGPSDAGRTRTGWLGTNALGTVSTGRVESAISGLAGNSTYYYRFYATNSAAGTQAWSQAASFTTAAPPAVNNGAGALSAEGRATLRGELTQGNVADIYLYWGRTDAGQSPGYEHVIRLPDTLQGSFQTNITAGCGFPYYYICFASNEAGTAWAPASTAFTLPQPARGYTYSNGLNASLFQPSPSVVDLSGAHYAVTFGRTFSGDKAGTALAMTPNRSAVLRGPADRWDELGGSAGDNFTWYLSGSFFPTVTGSYNFHWNQDDRGWLWMDVNENGMFDAGENVGDYAWNNNGSKALTAGHGYPFMFFSQEFGGGDNLWFAYTPPAGSEQIVNPTTQPGQWRRATGWTPGPNATNSPVSALTTNSATLNGRWAGLGWSFDLYACYGRTDGGTSAANWDTRVFLGTFHSQTGRLSFAVANLAPRSAYYYAFFATNALTNVWAQPSMRFETLGPVTAGNGSATGITQTRATLAAQLNGGGRGELWLYWGLTDGGTNAAAWQNASRFGEVLLGTYSTTVTVRAGGPYYYRAYAANEFGGDWADATATFRTPVPAVTLTTLPGTPVAEKAGQSTVTATVSAPSVSNVTVNFSFAGAAAKNTDYTSSADSIVIPAGSLSALITLTATDDLAQEEDEAAAVAIASLQHATNGTPTSVSPAITSDDPQVTNGSGASAVTQSSATLNGTLTMGDSATVRIYWGDNDGGTDFAAWDSTHTLGIRNEDAAFSAGITNLLANKTYYYRCYATNSSQLGQDWADSTVSFTTTVPSVSMRDAAVLEGDSGTAVLTFTLAISTLSAIDVSAACATADGTATDADFIATNAVVTIPAGRPGATFSVQVKGDTPFENPDELFYVNLASPSGCTIGDAQAAGTILDDDAAGQLAPFRHWMDVRFSGYAGASTLTNWPALLRLGTGIPGFSYRSFASPNGGDLRFASTDRTRLLHFDVERWDTNGESLVWVQVPALQPGGTTVRAYWNNASALALPYYATNGATWNDGFAGVWHMNEIAARDASGRKHDAVAQGAVAAVSGVIGRAVEFDAGEVLSIPATTDFRMQAGDFTMSAWVNPHANTGHGIFGSWNSGFILALYNGHLSFHADSPVAWSGNATPVANNDWQLVTMTRRGQDYRFFRNGVQGQQVTSAVNVSNYGTFEIGSGGPGWHGWWDGVIDEPRVETKWRSPDWLAATYQNQVRGSTFNSFGPVLGLPVIAATGASNITVDAAVATARLASTGGAATAVTLYWGDADGGNSPGAWANTQSLGTATSAPAAYAVTIAPLSAGTRYYYAFSAANASGTNWAAASFYSAGRPHIDNVDGALPGFGSAALRGVLRSNGETPTRVCTYWGEADGGTDKQAWGRSVDSGVLGVGPFSRTVSNLLYGVRYFYRSYATNAYGDAWAPASVSFVTRRPATGGGTLGSRSTDLLRNVPEAANYDLVYEFPIPVNSPGWNTAGNNPYSINRSAGFTKPFARVAYYLQLSGVSTTQWVYVSMDRFTADPTKIGLPTTLSGEYYRRGSGYTDPITNANIYSSEGSITKGTGVNTVNLEFWPSNYGQANDYGVPNASGSVFDFGDGGSGTGSGHGSMQIHNYGAGQTLFAYNCWGAARTSELGIGNQVGGGNPDWTFNTSNISAFTNRILQILVGPYPGSGVGLSNCAPNSLTFTSAVLNAQLACSGAVYSVSAFWGTANGGTNAAAWEHSAAVGAWTNVPSTNLICRVTGLAPSTDYFFAFRARNAAETMWATNVLLFTTPGPLAARFNASSTICNPFTTVMFNDTSVPGPAGTITNRFWDFGDGTTASTTATTMPHIYSTLGYKTVRLVVRDDVGGVSTNTKVDYIEVRASLDAYTWTPTAAGAYNWDNAGGQDNWGTWAGGAFPNATGATANLNVNLAGAQVISLNQAVTVGTLNLGDTAGTDFAQTIQAGTGGSLCFDVGAGSAQLNKTQSSATDLISATVTLKDPLQVNNEAAGAIQISGSVRGGSLTKMGAGVLILSGTGNTFTQAAVSGGTLRGDAASLVSDVALSNGANVTFDQAAAGVFSKEVGGAGSLVKTGAGTLTLTAPQTYSGATAIRGGTLQLRWSGGANGLRIMPTGDSITEGAGGSNAGYRGPLYSLLTAGGIPFQFVGSHNTNVGSLPSAPLNQQYHSGYGGWQVGGILTGVTPSAQGGYGWLSVTPDIITLMIGTNNNGQDIPTVIAQLGQIIDQVHNQLPNCLLMVSIITPRTDGGAAWVTQYNLSLVPLVNSKIAQGYNLLLVDLNTSYPAGTLPDNLHPNDAGYQWMAQQWYNAILANSGGGSDLLPVGTALSIASGSSLNLNGGSQRIGSLSDDSGAGGGVTNSNVGSASTLTVSPAAGAFAFSGRIRDGSGSGSIRLIKGGAGIQALAGNNTYSGGTVVSNGTLLVNNTAGSGTGLGAVSVLAGATLGGTGTAGGALTVASGGSVAPGTSVGTLTAGAGAALQADSRLTIDVSGAAADQWVVRGNLALAGTLSFAVASPPTLESYTLVTHTGARTGTFAAVENLPAGYEVVYEAGSIVLKRTLPVLTDDALVVEGGVPGLHFGTEAGSRYRLLYKDTLMDLEWLPVINPPVFNLPEGWSAVSTGAPLSIIDTDAEAQPHRFYRLHVEKP